MTLDSMFSGFIGGIIAAAITAVTSFLYERKREKHDRTANSLGLIASLEAFTISCAEYCSNAENEIDESIRRNDFHNLTNLRPPKFTIPPEVDFRTIDTGIASKILALPLLIKRSNNLAYEEFFYNSPMEATEVSIQQFSIRGLAAWEMADELRKKAEIPKPQFDDDWNFLDYLRKKSILQLEL